MKKVYLALLVLLSPLAVIAVVASFMAFLNLFRTQDPGEGGILIGSIFPIFTIVLILRVLIGKIKSGMQHGRI